MRTSRDFAAAEAQPYIKNHGGDEESFIAGWFARERHTLNQDSSLEFVDDRLDRIVTYVKELYHSHPEISSDYMGHNDPMANIMCLTAHIKNVFREYSELRREQQYMLFDVRSNP